ncbi:MAG TPA: hypothetical protein VGS19_19365, partial [Streptosporangiaceae bacterium]|nr:hypothetical protein [Streptosporangiaceae bacterium]
PLTGAAVGEPLVGHSEAVRAVAFATATAGMPLLASASEDRTVRLWDQRNGEPAVRTLTGHTDWVGSLAFTATPDGRPLLASAGGDKTIRIWDPGTGSPVMTLRRRSVIRRLAAGGPLLAIGDDEGLSVIELDATHDEGPCC